MSDAVPAPPPRVAFVSLGCRVNRVETDAIAAMLEAAGLALAPEGSADVIIVNTCAVTGEAEAKARKAVRRAAHLPQAPVVVATGCAASLFRAELEGLAPNVVVEPDKARVARRALEELGLGADAVSDEGALAQAPTPTGRTRPGIKVQDGCDNRCTYCIVWKARGPARSARPGQVVEAVRRSVERGAHEVVLTGINLGRYGAPPGHGGDSRLPELLGRILTETEVDRVRLSSIEPPDVSGRLLRVMASSDGRVAPFLHVCLQSGCDATLRRMGRVYDTALFREVVAQAREALPGLALGTDLIVGFPGEGEADFRESLAFCREMSFARMHVFRYSRRPGTPAATAPGQVDPRVMARRSRQALDLARELRLGEARRVVGRLDDVIVEHPGRGVTSGLFDVIVDPGIPLGSMERVRVVGCGPDATLTACRA